MNFEKGYLDIFAYDYYVKSVQIRSIFGTYFPVLGLNSEIYYINLPIQLEYREIWTRKNPVFGHFSHSVRKS